MASLSLYLDQRYNRGDGKFPVKFKVSLSNNRGILLNSGIKIFTDQWMNNEIVRHDNKKYLNQFLRQRMNDITNSIMAMELSGEITRITLDELKHRILIILGRKTKDDHTFITHFRSVIESHKKQSTKSIYIHTLKKIDEFDNRNLSFEDINYAWLKKFESSLIDSGMKINSIAIHFRNIRAVINDAINNEITG